MDAVSSPPVRSHAAPDCGSCGRAGGVLHADLEDRLYGAPGHWRLLLCDRCGLVWLDPRPEAEDLGRLYERYHTHDAEPRTSGYQHVVRRAIPAAALGYRDRTPPGALGPVGRLLARVGPLREAAYRSVMTLPGDARGRLLDVGCGAGLFLSVMRDLGWQVLGSETDPAAVAAARARLGADAVREGELAALALPDAQFAAVTLSHVIEHLLDPAAALRECARLLAPGGRLVLATPNAQSLGARRFGPAWRGWEVPRHIRVYDARTLRAAVEGAGLRVRSVETVSTAAVPLYLDGLRLERSQPGDAPVAERPLGVVDAMRAVAFWLREYAALARDGDAGEEVLLVAERAG